MQHRLIILTGAGLIAVVFAVSLPFANAQEQFPPVSPGGYLPSGQTPNGYNPVPGGYQPSPVPSQPVVPNRPDSFPGGPTPPITGGWGNPAAATPAAPAYGPIYQPGQQSRPGGAVQASFVGPSYSAGRSIRCVPTAPAQLCSGALTIGRVANEIILTSDLFTGIDDMMSRSKSRLPPEKLAEQRAALAQEVTDGISELNAHYHDPDPVKALLPSHKTLLYQLVRQQVDVKLIYQDFLKTVPKEHLPDIQENVDRHFEETQLKILMKRENVTSRADLETALRAKGSSLERERRVFMEQIVAQQWVQQQVKGDERDKEEEVTHEEMRKWYQAHLKDFEKPAKARWEELMIAFSRHANRDEAYAAVAALGNRVLAGASFADVAKSGSEGPTARQGGQRDWTHTGSLSSETLNQAIFSLPVEQLSQILESSDGFHIIRVVERQELSRTSFLNAQKEIKENIKKERIEKRYQKFVKDLHEKYPVWTIFDNALQEPKNQDDEDRYSRR